MRLLDRIAQCATPFVVQDFHSATTTRLNGPADYAVALRSCALRYVLDEGLTRLCAALAFSKGSRALECADLLHVPADSVWLEWPEAPWRGELDRYGFPLEAVCSRAGGLRGALLEGTRDGRRGRLRTFWSGDASDEDVLASNVEAYFDLDVLEGEEPAPYGELTECAGVRVHDGQPGAPDVLGRCFRFRYERSWGAYYRRRIQSQEQAESVARHALGTIAHDVPLVLAFLLLLAARSGLPRRASALEQINHARKKRGKPALLDHIEISAPLLPEFLPRAQPGAGGGRRWPRLHYVRGHLVRRGHQLYWRTPHLRGNARAGFATPRTMIWTLGGSHDGQRRGTAGSGIAAS